MNRGQCDLVLLDSQFPDGTGADFMLYYTILAKAKRIKMAPVASMSKNSAQCQELAYAGYHMHAFLEKPVTKSQLLGVLRSIH